MKNILRIVVGILAIVIGAIMIFDSYKTMDGTKEKVKHKITGSYSKDIKYNMIGGAILIVVGGGILYYFRGKKR
jgi:uncharacterized protein YxeA